MVETCSQRATWFSASPAAPSAPTADQWTEICSVQSELYKLHPNLHRYGPIRNLVCLFCNPLLGNFLSTEVSKMVGQGEKERPLKSLAEGQCPLQPGSGSEELKWDPGRGGHLTFPICVMGVIHSAILSGGGQLPWHRHFNDIRTLWGL